MKKMIEISFKTTYLLHLELQFKQNRNIFKFNICLNNEQINKGSGK